jgi:flavin reductase (DIM6/NTAB) family NADH-FMN oxidoreductase RutF
MNYDPIKKNHGLARDPLTALMVPRPIGWISTISRDGVNNLAVQLFQRDFECAAIRDVLQCRI